MSHLFSNEPLIDFLNRSKINLKREIESTDVKYLLTVIENDFVNYLIPKYSFGSVKLNETGITQTQEEIRLDGYEKPTPLNPTMLTGKIKVTIIVPFEGNSSLFHCRPSKSLYILPKGKVEIEHQNKKIRLEYETNSREAEIIKDIIRQDIETIKRWLGLVNDDLVVHNSWVKEKTKPFLLERKNQLIQNLGFIQSLGIPLEEDTNISKTYPISLEAKKISLPKPEPLNCRIKPELFVSQNDYENILEIISHMSLAMERNPKTFSKLREEEIRDFFLIVLNSHFKGQATSETFNDSGKNDILLRIEDKNVFIAECKFWIGKRSLTKAIDQILKYLSWRDTKAAILFFYRGKSLSRTLETIPQLISEHRFYKAEFKLNNQKLASETTFTAVLQNRNDKNRHLLLTVMFFPILARQTNCIDHID